MEIHEILLHLVLGLIVLGSSLLGLVERDEVPAFHEVGQKEGFHLLVLLPLLIGLLHCFDGAKVDIHLQKLLAGFEFVGGLFGGNCVYFSEARKDFFDLLISHFLPHPHQDYGLLLSHIGVAIVLLPPLLLIQIDIHLQFLVLYDEPVHRTHSLLHLLFIAIVNAGLLASSHPHPNIDVVYGPELGEVLLKKRRNPQVVPRLWEVLDVGLEYLLEAQSLLFLLVDFQPQQLALYFLAVEFSNGFLGLFRLFELNVSIAIGS